MIWHFTKDNDYPKVFGEYEKKEYPQIPCLVMGHGFCGVRHFNITEQCWDDEDADDYVHDKEFYEKWAYIDELENLV